MTTSMSRSGTSWGSDRISSTAIATTTRRLCPGTEIPPTSSRPGPSPGFESQRPWASGDTSPPSLTAIDKHPYMNMRRFPQDSVSDAPGVRPLDSLGRTDGLYQGATNRWSDNFVPTYDAFFPEYYLNALQTESSIR